MRKLGIYVQVPFCQTKCTYCNFHTGVVASSRFAPYVEAVCREIREHRELLRAAGVGEDLAGKAHGPIRQAQGKQEWLCHEAVVDTVYIGGGTPSLLDPSHLQNILDVIRATFVTDLAEVTLEADPETVQAEKAAAWVRAGINRVSFGLQSFTDKELIAAGRMHRRADIYRAVPILREAGTGNISFDLIAGLPHQTKESWRQSLRELAALAPEHVSVYLLEIDEGSRLGKELLKGGGRYSAGAVPSEDEMAEFYEMAQEALGEAGYHHYEISNWAKPGFESRHNLKYWRREPYVGFGAGAHSFSGTERWANAHDAATYVAAVQSERLLVEQHEMLTADSALEEELFLGLRQLDGIDLGRIEREYGVTLGARFDRITSAGLVEREGSVVRLSPEKLSVSNEVFVELMR
ncbi:MAG TPA: radical SAM family heme chaperone HemW [Candidatus Polarisedimenticolia bacterium]|nr:radical SAM family heme chaperone HemW [Candidatus Polarisedimenticolia bacterium]